ncbi:uncharacterized protein LOC117648264 [Thrips palmi]|uniref:Uncharacterized protein LOC117648264 n=1 Tax=Thrips palmi TaxID=161013 RepID=A0A6P8Z818_THRPL|nr:uncharacterized protein LOC117648264 [Thrips palmi]
MQCPICYEVYNQQDRRPKIVPCGHTFCLVCLKSLRVKECPTCRTMFACPPEGLIDNFLALEETADMKFVHRALWCDTCNDAPQPDCVKDHDVLSSRMAQARLEDAHTASLLAEEQALLAERKAHERMRFGFEDAVDALNADTARAEAALRNDRGAAGTIQRRYSTGGVLGGGSSGVRATLINIKASKARAEAAHDKLEIMDATQAEIKVKCGEADTWRYFSLDVSQEAQEMHKLVLFSTYLLARLKPACVRTALTYEVTASVAMASRGISLPDITLEFDERPSPGRLVEQWAKGWKIYSICKGCLESCHTQSFTPQPPVTSARRVEKGCLCLGRANGRFYFILCDDMETRFLLPLSSSFTVVGRVTRNLSSLEEAAKSLRGSPRDALEITPKL